MGHVVEQAAVYIHEAGGEHLGVCSGVREESKTVFATTDAEVWLGLLA